MISQTIISQAVQTQPSGPVSYGNLPPAQQDVRNSKMFFLEVGIDLTADLPIPQADQSPGVTNAGGLQHQPRGSPPGQETYYREQKIFAPSFEVDLTAVRLRNTVDLCRFTPIYKIAIESAFIYRDYTRVVLAADTSNINRFNTPEPVYLISKVLQKDSDARYFCRFGTDSLQSAISQVAFQTFQFELPTSVDIQFPCCMNILPDDRQPYYCNSPRIDGQRDLSTGRPFLPYYYTNQFVSKINLRFSIVVDMQVNVKTLYTPSVASAVGLAENLNDEKKQAAEEKANNMGRAVGDAIRTQFEPLLAALGITKEPGFEGQGQLAGTNPQAPSGGAGGIRVGGGGTRRGAGEEEGLYNDNTPIEQIIKGGGGEEGLYNNNLSLEKTRENPQKAGARYKNRTNSSSFAGTGGLTTSGGGADVSGARGGGGGSGGDSSSASFQNSINQQVSTINSNLSAAFGNLHQGIAHPSTLGQVADAVSGIAQMAVMGVMTYGMMSGFAASAAAAEVATVAEGEAGGMLLGNASELPTPPTFAGARPPAPSLEPSEAGNPSLLPSLPRSYVGSDLGDGSPSLTMGASVRSLSADLGTWSDREALGFRPTDSEIENFIDRVQSESTRLGGAATRSASRPLLNTMASRSRIPVNNPTLRFGDSLPGSLATSQTTAEELQTSYATSASSSVARTETTMPREYMGDRRAMTPDSFEGSSSSTSSGSRQGTPYSTPSGTIDAIEEALTAGAPDLALGGEHSPPVVPGRMGLLVERTVAGRLGVGRGGRFGGRGGRGGREGGGGGFSAPTRKK